MQKYIIGEVLDKDTRQRSKEFGYRVGWECTLFNDRENLWKEGCSLIIEYPDGRCCRTSSIEDFEQTDYGMWVTTKNRIYRFDYIYEENKDGGCIENTLVF